MIESAISDDIPYSLSTSLKASRIEWLVVSSDLKKGLSTPDIPAKVDNSDSGLGRSPAAAGVVGVE